MIGEVWGMRSRKTHAITMVTQHPIMVRSRREGSRLHDQRGQKGAHEVRCLLVAGRWQFRRAVRCDVCVCVPTP